jgi:3-oxoacyl-[acyl-carrier-protein] synthase-3
MNGRETFKRAVKAMALAAERLLEKCQISVDQVKLFFPHQANIRIIEAMAEYAHLSLERFWVVLSRTGNTSSASVGIALKDAVSKNQLQENDFAVLVAFGGGMTSGAALLRFLR